MKKQSREDYLRTIYTLFNRLDNPNEGIKSVDIAKSLNLSKPAVSEMIRKLSKEGFIKMNPYSKIFLTDKGIVEAKRVTNNYNIIETFLKKVLRIPKQIIDDEAHRLEHSFSDEAIKRLMKLNKKITER